MATQNEILYSGGAARTAGHTEGGTAKFACLICDGTKHRAVFKEKGVDILRCENCGHVFSSFRGDPHYQGFWGEEVAPGLPHYWSRARAKMHGDFFARFIENKSGKLLDMGSGLGFFVKAMSRFPAWDAHGCEISPAAVKYAREQLGLRQITCSRLQDAKFERESFDIVTMWDVLDHIIQPDPLLSHCHSVLKQDGLLFIRTPNIALQLLRGRLLKALPDLGRDTTHLQPFDHFHHYSPNTIRRLLERNGFTDVEFLHLHPIRTGSGWKAAVINPAKAAWFHTVRALAVLTGGTSELRQPLHRGPKGFCSEQMTHLVVISRADAGELDDRIVGLSQWMGVPTTKLVIDDRNGLERLNALLQQEQVNIAISEAALASLRRCTPAETLRGFIESRCARLLVYRAGHPMPDHSPLPWLTHEMVRGASNPTLHASFRLPDAARHFSGALAGQTFDLKEPVALSTFKFAAADQDGRVDILLAGDAPVLTRMMCGVCELFLLSLARLPDVRQQLPADEEAHDYFDALLPILIFLRHGFADLFWRGSGGTAHLIIDDPLLVDRYGFLDYTALCHSMRAAGYESTIAFIPWNHWRTSRKAADSFRGEASLSICVHGCDHTNREFSDVDPHSLQWKADTAMTRMEDHEHRTGLPFDRIMVFPQGHFSSSALSALRTAGYLAAVNTTVFPTDAAGEAITLGDLMRPAVAKQHGFPVFQRRSPRSIVDFAFDAFLGRPMLVVQHHEDFRDGFRHLEDLARKMHSLDPTIRRGALSDGLMRSCIARAPTPGAMDVHFYTRRFRFTNPHPHRVVVSFSKDEPSPSRVANVFAGGVDVAFSTDGQRLTFGRVLEANERIEIEIQDRARSDRLAGAPSWAHTTRVVARRALSEFRDNSLSRHPRLLTRAKNVARRLSLTGSSEG